MKNEPNPTRQLAVYGAVLSALVVYPLVIIGGGWYLIRKNQWPTWVIVFPALLAMSGAFYQIYRYLRWSDDSSPDSSSEKK